MKKVFVLIASVSMMFAFSNCTQQEEIEPIQVNKDTEKVSAIREGGRTVGAGQVTEILD
ncbi:hypothetical protein [Algivirga pacifica]|uniref:Efflux transporter periplasmic adaptor subunit n=1 Tax=Algivirga pacifica TaxID=1162670 RepID=A0ABP9D3J9_9BACT